MAYTNIGFTADFPDDGIEQGDGEDWEIVRPSGMAMAFAIADLVKAVGMPVTEPEADIDHYCWVFATGVEQKLFWVRVYDLSEDERSVMIEGSSPFMKRWFNRRDFYLEFLDTLYALLCSDPKFGSVNWLDKKP